MKDPAVDVVEKLISALGLLYILVALPPAIGAPIIVLVKAIKARMEGRRGVYRAICFGLWMSLWSFWCWLLIPYLGVYPNIIGALLADMIGVGRDSYSYWLIIWASALSVWFVIGVIVFCACVKGLHNGASGTG